MPRYWVIAPIQSKNSELFDKVWSQDRDTNVISVGWQRIGDASAMSRETLAEVVAEGYPDKPRQTQSLIANMIYAFYHEIQPGDWILARRGRKILTGVGQVTTTAVYSPDKSPFHAHAGILGVRWREDWCEKTFSSIVFPMHTLAETTEEQFRALTEGTVVAPLGTEQSVEVEDSAEFVLEKYLEEFIVSNFAGIFQGQLQIYVDSDGNEGQQYGTDIGPIDILAYCPGDNAYVVIELKKGRSSDKVVGQVLRYMGWVKQNLCDDKQSVKGLIVCSDEDPKLSFALSMTNNIDVRYYRVTFTLNERP